MDIYQRPKQNSPLNSGEKPGSESIKTESLYIFGGGFIRQNYICQKYNLWQPHQMLA